MGINMKRSTINTAINDAMGDPLRMWRELTAERGIALYGHYSGVFDMMVATDHPDWAVIDEDGVESTEKLSVFGPYADEILIPQLLELALEYGLDGAWVDGECWATQVDYSKHAVMEYHKLYGMDKNPPKADQDGYFEYKEFCREGFSKYVNHYIQEVKAKAPTFQLTSNWMYSAYMPERPKVSVDFLSGDYSARNSVDSARINGRFLSNQGVPWDLMAWGHHAEGNWTTKDRTTKEYVQHCQEAAYVLSLGGGFQFYNLQYNGGSTVQEWAIPIWKRIAEFVRAREPFCRGAKQFPQIAIFLSSLAHRKNIETLFSQSGRVMSSARGNIHLAQDCGYSSEILETHNLFDCDLSQYGTIIIADTNEIEPAAKNALLSYAKNGGSLLLASADSSRCFSDITQIIMDLPCEKQIHVESEGMLASIVTMSSKITHINGKIKAVYYDSNYMEGTPEAAAVFTCYGEGKIVSLCFDIGRVYPKNRTTCIRNFYKNLMGDLFPKPIVTVEGSDYIDISVMQRDNTLFVHLLNYSGPHNSTGYRSYNNIPELGPLDITLFLKEQPVSIYIEPEHKKCEILYSNGKVSLRVDRLKIHSIISIKLQANT